MTLFLLAYLGGVLTIVSPCILPVLPFVFTRAGQPFLRNGLPMLLGMALTFALVGTLAAVAGGWAIAANRYGRDVALALLAVFGLTLLFPRLSDRVMRPLVALGGRLSETADAGPRGGRGEVAAAALLGVATGLLWAPCAGPILGLILTGAALQGASVQASLLLLAYAAGSATSLALALRLGGGFFNAMKRSIGASEWIRRALGALVLVAVAAIAFGLDAGLLTRLSTASTSSLEQGLLDKARVGAPPPSAAPAASGVLPVEGVAPPLAGAVEWLNSPPLTLAQLKGKVVVVDFWTYSCINCLRSLPYVRAWAEKYKEQGLVVIGVHAPEFAFEKNVDNVKKAVADLHIGYPVAIDNDFAIWRAFHNNYWPAHYFIDAQGRIRHHHFGEGHYEDSERVIRQLLAEAGHAPGGALATAAVAASGIQQAADMRDVKSPETYVGYARAENFAGTATRDAPARYTVPPAPPLNRWGLVGAWTVKAEHAEADAAGASIVYRFHARDLHLVLGPGADGQPVRFRVTIDGQPPGASHGDDTDADGRGTVDSQRLYQLVRQPGPVQDHTFEIRFEAPGVQAFAFTFG
jgi:cytochrome c biogenesis protein CcdA/thiol-disulfide isomerase/thioredoxin